MMTKSRRVLFSLTALLLGVALSAATAEVVLRLSGHHPWRNFRLNADEPIMFAPDAVLGWHGVPGRYVVPPYGAGGPTTQVTLLADGTRATGGASAERPALIFLGCSFTQGSGISDEETFAWRVQQMFPGAHVVNNGIAAYGTYQSLLVMERLLAAPDPPPLVLYGLMEEHEGRNVADPAWLRVLDLYSKEEMIATPYATLDGNGALVRHAPEAYPRWPLRTHLALVPFLESWYLQVHARGRAAQARAVTEQLLLEMQRVAERHGARFGIVLLHFSPDAKAHYVEFLARHHIDFVDCAFPISADLRVVGDTHPNGVMHARYADCIAAKIRAAGWLGARPQ